MTTHGNNLESRDPELSSRGAAYDLAQHTPEGQRKRNPVQTLLALLILPLSLGLALLVGIAALVVALKRLSTRLGALR